MKWKYSAVLEEFPDLPVMEEDAAGCRCCRQMVEEWLEIIIDRNQHATDCCLKVPAALKCLTTSSMAADTPLIMPS